MKTAVSIPDALFDQAEKLAHRLGKSRSRLYREALAEYVMRREPGVVTHDLDETIAGVGGEIDGWVGEAGLNALERSKW